MRVLVFGAGAMGSLIGGLLSARHEVTLLGRRGHVEAIKKRGLKITGKTEAIVWPRAVTDLPRTSQDLVLVSTKAYDTEAAMSELKPLWHSSIFLTMQNGLRNADTIARNADRCLAGTTSHGVTFIENGWIRHAGLGDTHIGPFHGVSSGEVRNLCSEFTACGIPAEYSGNIRRNLWLKVIVNSSINPLTAIMRIENGRLLRIPQLAALMRTCSTEGAAVARAEGFDISDREALAVTTKVAERTASNRSSMLQDVERGRRTEVEEISGAIVNAATRHGLRVPVTETAALAVACMQER